MSVFFRIASAVPQLEVANPAYNAEKIIELYKKSAGEGASAVLFPELAVTGSTCGDLFEQKLLLDSARSELKRIAGATAGKSACLIVGVPWLCGSRLYNTAAVCRDGKVCGFAVKRSIPGFRNCDQKRYFSSAESLDRETVFFDGEDVPFASDMVFETPDYSFAVEFGSDLTSVVSGAAALASAGANVIFSPGSGADTAFSASARRNMICSESARLVSVCAYSGCGVCESSGEFLSSGHALIADNGRLAAENRRFERSGSIVYADFNPQWLDLHRRARSNFNDLRPVQVKRVCLSAMVPAPDFRYAGLQRNPFLPEDPESIPETCREIFSIQASALAKRFCSSGAKRMVIGLSGGLDSTLALLVALKCCDLLGLPHSAVCAVTMPGFGTSGRTKNNALVIAGLSGVELREIPIHDAVEQHFRDIGHDPENRNVVYENSQARERTQILMDIANGIGGIVIGTGDLSEIALGWSTFNGDHMAMYSVNCGIPKTLMRWMVEFAASESDGDFAAALRDICATPVSPELLPGAQHTENIIGSYELHDFFLYHLLRYGEAPEMLEKLAAAVFADVFSADEISKTLDVFTRRFFTQQFKRNAAPEGPCTCEVSLGAKGDWKMPSDCAVHLWKRG